MHQGVIGYDLTMTSLCSLFGKAITSRVRKLNVPALVDSNETISMRPPCGVTVPATSEAMGSAGPLIPTKMLDGMLCHAPACMLGIRVLFVISLSTLMTYRVDRLLPTMCTCTHSCTRPSDA